MGKEMHKRRWRQREVVEKSGRGKEERKMAGKWRG